jgi:hypothetical protein
VDRNRQPNDAAALAIDVVAAFDPEQLTNMVRIAFVGADDTGMD